MILVNPHGGSSPLDGAVERRKEKSRDPQFSKYKDLATAELTEQLHARFPPQASPSLLLAHIHRKYVDYNRPLDYATQSSVGQASHTRFHRALSHELDRLKKRFGWVLLIDIHGQSALDFDVIVGTRQGKTVSEWSDAVIWSDILPELRRHGFSTAPQTPSTRFKYNGGHIVKHYGQDPRVEAWQLEHGKSLRFDKLGKAIYCKTLVAKILPAVQQRLKSR